MAEADLDVVIRQTAKAQNKSLMAAIKKRRDQIMARAAKAKDRESRDQLRSMARSTMELGRPRPNGCKTQRKSPPTPMRARSVTPPRKQQRRRRRSLPRKRATTLL